MENLFQWGYGRKQIRGRSTTVSIDGIKDTEFTCYKDTVKEFLNEAGLPVPRGGTYFEVEPALEMARELGFPVVVKPVSGHKGQGVTTNIQSLEEVRGCFETLMEAGVADGIIVEKQVSGYDHRILTVGGTCVAVLKRIPAYVDGDGEHTIEELIIEENKIFVRRNNARSPLTSIKIDDDLVEYLALQELDLSSVVDTGRRVYLRRVANISAGGVSINVTDEAHPDNKLLAETVASYLNIHALGVDVLADDITQSWRESPLSIIEINAGPGVFMHLSPAQGGSIDVPGAIMNSLFPGGHRGRIPIIVGNELSSSLTGALAGLLRSHVQNAVVGFATSDGVFIHDRFLFKGSSQWSQVSVLLRNQRLDAAIIEYHEADILADGLRYYGADIVCLFDPTDAERVLTRDIEPGGWLVTTPDVWPIEELGPDVRVCLLDPDDTCTAPGTDVDVIVSMREEKPHFSGDWENKSGRVWDGLDGRDLLLAAFMDKAVSWLMTRYSPDGSDVR